MNENSNDKIFPKHFFWGASVAAHQVEGNLENQWTVWERKHAKELAQTAHQRLSWIPVSLASTCGGAGDVVSDG